MRFPSQLLTPILLLASLVGWPAAGGATLVGFAVDGDSIVGRLEFPPNLAVDVELEFEQVLGLSLESVGLSARLVSATELLGRLPQGVALSGSLPVLLAIEPPANGPLSFAGVATLELHTHNLAYVPNCPLRLFKAPVGGTFEDITSSMGAGSYRAGGSSGDFSEFLILVESRLPNAVTGSKFGALEDLLAAHWQELPAGLGEELLGFLDEAWSSYTAAQYATASQNIGAFARAVEQNQASVPAVWRASRDLVNVAGELRAAASTLQFSLNLLSN